MASGLDYKLKTGGDRLPIVADWRKTTIKVLDGFLKIMEIIYVFGAV